MSGLLLANNEEAVRLLGVEGTLEEELDVTFLNDPLGWVANEIANGIKDRTTKKKGSRSPRWWPCCLYSIAGGRWTSGSCAKAVVEFLQEDAG